MPVSSVTAEVQANLEYHSRLVERLSELGDAPGALEEHKRYHKDIKKRHRKSGERIKRLQLKTEKERTEYELIRDSRARKLSYKVFGMKEYFAEKQAKEEREYVEALEEEMKERENLNILPELIAAAEAATVSYEQKAIEHSCIRCDINALYSRLFDGPTEEVIGYPAEDALEDEFLVAQDDFNGVQASHDAESRALGCLKEADEKMKLLLASIEKAMKASKNASHNGYNGGARAVSKKRTALSNAQRHLDSAKQLLGRAHDASPYVNKQCIVVPSIDKANSFSDYMFTNYFSERSFRDRMKSMKTVKSQAAVHQETNKSQDRLNNVSMVLDQKKSDLRRCRQELDNYRRRIFEFVRDGTGGDLQAPPPPTLGAAGESSDEPLPAYSR